MFKQRHLPIGWRETIGSPIAWMSRVESKYRLLHPIIGFCQSLKRLVTIPAGTTITLSATPPEIGVCPFTWDGRRILALRKDVEKNSVVEMGTAARG